MWVEYVVPLVIPALRILSPSFAVIDHCSRRLVSPHCEYRWRVMWRWQNGWTVSGKEVWNAHMLGDGRSSDLKRRGAHDQVTTLSCGCDRCKLRCDSAFHHLTYLLWCGRGCHGF